MNNWIEMDFGEDPVSGLTEDLKQGDLLPASQLLAALDEQSQTLLEETFDRLWEQGVVLVLDDIPISCADAETALRLRREAQLTSVNALLQALESTDPLRLYLEELAAIAVCGDLPELAQPLQQANEAGDGDAQVYTDVMNLCLSRVVERALCYAGKGVLLLDLIQEGSMGLWSRLFSYTDGDLEAFCNRCIDHAMVCAVIAQAHAGGVGQKLRSALEDYRSVDERLLTELGRNPTLEEIAQAMHMTPAQTAVVADMVDNARMLNRAKNPGNTQQVPEEEDQAVEDTAYYQMRQRIAELLSALSQQDAQLLTLRYGLEGGMPLTPEQAGAKLGLTPEEVIARETAALAQLRAK